MTATMLDTRDERHKQAAATNLIRAGASLAAVKQLLGHSSVRTTVDLYTHLDLEDARQAVRLLDTADV